MTAFKQVNERMYILVDGAITFEPLADVIMQDLSLDYFCKWHNYLLRTNAVYS